VLRVGLKSVLVGLGAGLVGAFIVSCLIRSPLFAITSLDGLTYCLAIVMLIAVAIAACWFPSRAATGTDPIASLRYE
jgi:ABC-type antimicrobial peptide transport system permease subunit